MFTADALTRLLRHSIARPGQILEDHVSEVQPHAQKQIRSLFERNHRPEPNREGNCAERSGVLAMLELLVQGDR